MTKHQLHGFLIYQGQRPIHALIVEEPSKEKLWERAIEREFDEDTLRDILNAECRSRGMEQDSWGDRWRSV